MATPILHGNTPENTGSDSIIAGYFQSGEDAHLAISALLDEGFLPSQIGAAFHTSGTPGATSGSSRSEDVLGGDSSRQELGTTVNASLDSDTSAGGASSDDFAVQPVGMGSGGGTPILGAGKPGPIPGSSLEHTGLPSELKHEQLGNQPSSQAGTAAGISTSQAGSGPQQHGSHQSNTSWLAKIKNLLEPKHESKPSTSTARSEGQDFGTGEGRLGVEPSGFPYSPGEFERSVSGFGVAPEHSRHLSHRLSGGGAVVTVNATGRATEVEKIFERHNGQVRFASSVFEDSPQVSGEPRVELFGHLEHIYPNYNR